MSPPIRRRDAIRAAMAGLAATTVLRAGPPPFREVRAFRLVEPIGLRRFGFPVRATVPDGVGGVNYRLMIDGRVVPAQFRPVEGDDGKPAVALDFEASLGPLESARYEVQFGLGVEPGPEPGAGLKLDRRDGGFLVTQDSGLAFEVGGEPGRFLRAVGSPRLAYLGREPAGLVVRSRGGADHAPEGKFASTITRHGPMAVGIRIRPADPSATPATIDLTIPRSKSWVEVVAAVDDPAGKVDGLGLDLGLLLEGPTTLVDFGAGSTVYGSMAAGARMEMEAGPGDGWAVRRGDGTSLAASPPGSHQPAEGWAHVMDARRCTAMAVDGFGRTGAVDRVAVEAGGGVRIRRKYPEGSKGPRGIAAWLHFVPMPVHSGAATSPQSILAPPRVEWDRPRAPSS